MASGGNNRKPPASDELEVSVFGPGFGECVVLHFGSGEWGVVDSCIHPDSKRPVALHYLESLNVNVAQSIRLVAGTHWHDDHMQGVSSVFQAAESAVFACTSAVREPDLKQILATWTGTRFLAGGSGIDELNKVMLELKKRRDRTRYPAPRLCSANTILWQQAPPGALVRALSPSDAAVLATIARLTEFAPMRSKMRRRLPDVEPNDASVVVSVEVGEHRVLLGADLQVRQDRGLGWMAIVDAHLAGTQPHHGFKVSHHGSENGDHDEIWNQLLIRKPWAVITPFVSGKVSLPTASDCRRLLSRTSNSYLTARPQAARYSDGNRAVEKTVKEATRLVQVVPGAFGQVRLRKKIHAPANTPWAVELFGKAATVEDYVCTLEG
jgi:hypothetical protein